jgi:hypothetical protein
MKATAMSWMFLSVNVLVASLPIYGYPMAAVTCLKVHSSDQRGLPEIKIDWKNDQSYLEGMQRKEVLGQVDTFFSKEWDTQVYYTATGLPNALGRAPLVDPESKAVFIFFHGSGTMKSGGRNFIANMNILANLGYSAISFDYPFHSQGSRNVRMHENQYFMEYVKKIVMEAKKSGKPVILAGHSFGPDIIHEFNTRYPKLVDGIASISPAGFTKELEKWYDNHTTKMNFGGDVAENRDGGLWAGNISKQFIWSKGKLPDPTQVNPSQRMIILSGDREEYVPAPLGGPNNTPIGPNTYDISVPLQKLFKNAKIIIEPGIGHYIFEHVDKDGHNVVLRTLLQAAGADIKQMKQMTEATRADQDLWAQSEKAARKYSQDPLFKAWADEIYGPGTVLRLARQQKETWAKKLMEDYQSAKLNRELEIHQRILATKQTNPDFYAKYKTLIDNSKPHKPDVALFYPFLNLVLKAQNQE